MDKNFFKKTRILDGGMGQEILNRGAKIIGGCCEITPDHIKEVKKII